MALFPEKKKRHNHNDTQELYGLLENYAQTQIKKLWLAEQTLHFLIWFVRASHQSGIPLLPSSSTHSKNKLVSQL